MPYILHHAWKYRVTTNLVHAYLNCSGKSTTKIITKMFNVHMHSFACMRLVQGDQEFQNSRCTDCQADKLTCEVRTLCNLCMKYNCCNVRIRVFGCGITSPKRIRHSIRSHTDTHWDTVSEMRYNYKIIIMHA